MIKRKADIRRQERSCVQGGQGTIYFDRVWERDTELKSQARLFSTLTLNPGVTLGYHTHEKEEEIYLILSGRALVNDNGKEVILEAGDTTITQSGEGHAIACYGEEPLVFLAVIVPYKQN